MKVPKKLLKQFVSSVINNDAEQYRSLYVNESEGYIFFMLSGYQCFFIALNGNSLPKHMFEQSFPQITCDEIGAKLSRCGDMVDLSEFESKETDLGLTRVAFSLFLRMNKSSTYPKDDLINHEWLANVTTFLKSALTTSTDKKVCLNISYLEKGNYAFKAKTDELDFLCVTAPEED